MQLSIGLIICYFAVGIAYETTLYFDDSSCYTYGNTYHIYDDDATYNLQWNGGYLSDNCKMTFDPVDTEKQICVKAYTYDVHSCDLKLKYYGGLIADELERTYSCYDSKPVEFCGDTFGNVAVQMSSVSSSPSSFFSLQIYRKGLVHLKDLHVTVAVIIACSVGGAIVLGVIVTIVVVIACRRRRAMAGTVYGNTTGYQQTIITSSNASNMNLESNQSYPPPPYPGTRNIENSFTAYPATSQPTGCSRTSYPATSQPSGYSHSTGQKY